MEKRNFSSSKFIKYPHEKKVVIQKKVLHGLLCSVKVVTTALSSTIRSFIASAHIIISYKHFGRKRTKTCSHENLLSTGSGKRKIRQD